MIESEQRDRKANNSEAAKGKTERSRLKKKRGRDQRENIDRERGSTRKQRNANESTSEGFMSEGVAAVPHTGGKPRRSACV